MTFWYTMMNEMKRPKKEIGQIGVGLCILGTLMMVAGAFLLWSNQSLGYVLLFLGPGIYLPGGLMASATFGYRRGGKLFWILMMCRSTMALAFVWSLLKILS